MTDEIVPVKAVKSSKTTQKQSTDRLENLERCIAKMAHYSGTSRILDEFGINRWVPGKDDMRKIKG